MARIVSPVLKQLESVKDMYGEEIARQKLELLGNLKSSRLSNSKEVFRLHEILCFLRAFPDNRPLLDEVEAMLRSFDRRKDLLAYCRDLEDTGIAGTGITYGFYWFTALWLAKHWPGQLAVSWKDFAREKDLKDLFRLIITFSETMGLDETDLSLRRRIKAAKGPLETDAFFLIRRFARLRVDSFTREMVYERLDMPIRVVPGPTTPSRTRAKDGTGPVVFQSRPLERGRPSLLEELKRPPLSIRRLPVGSAVRIIHLAREAMVTRSRDLDIFECANPQDVHMVDCGDGLQFACIGAIPERRFLLEAVYAFLTLKNGVPIGYVLASAFFRSSEVAYNVFETFRGAESAKIYGRVIAMVHHLFESDAFTVDPYQLGKNNREGLKSGAWWFYYKLGFRPHDPGVLRVLEEELRRMKRNPAHRSDIPTLERLSSKNMFLYARKERADVLGRVSFDTLRLQISKTLARRSGADREAGIESCSREMAGWLGVRSFSGFSKAEKLAWERWSPLVVSMPEIANWKREQKKALVEIIRAKGGKSELGFVRLVNRHPLLSRSIVTLSESEL